MDDELEFVLPLGPPPVITNSIAAVLYTSIFLSIVFDFPIDVAKVLVVVCMIFLSVYAFLLNRDVQRLCALMNGPRPSTLDDE